LLVKACSVVKKYIDLTAISLPIA